MKIALVQTYIYWENKEKNLNFMEKVVKHYGDRGIDMFLFPEMSLTGYTMNMDKVKENDHYTVDAVSSIAARYKAAIGIGWIKDCGDYCENCYSLVTPSGASAEYVKMHPFSIAGEDMWCRGGRSITKCNYKGFSIGMQLCYDLRFPDTFVKASEGVDIVIVPACWPAARNAHWNTLLKARAIENQVYVAGINCAGNISGIYYSGESAIYNPDGNACFGKSIKISRACTEAQIMIYDIENDVERFRSAFPILKDRINNINEE